MTSPNDTVYILSANYSGEKLMYYAAVNRLGSTLKLSQANVFHAREEAEEELDIIAGHWQIQTISAKKLFAARLKGS